jgi:hypothetical protein
MAHLAKYTLNSAQALFHHNLRHKDRKGEYVAYGGSKIDTTKTQAERNTVYALVLSRSYKLAKSFTERNNSLSAVISIPALRARAALAVISLHSPKSR